MDVDEVTLETWDAIERTHNELLANRDGRWNFRGQSSSAWGLETSLERAFKQFGIHNPLERLQRETVLIKEFRRYAHLYRESAIRDDDTLACLAVMQHYGAPTRLLDFTYSFYVALFFAVEGMAAENESKSGKCNERQTKTMECAVYAIDRHELDGRLQLTWADVAPRVTDRHFENPQTFSKFFLDGPPKKLVYPLNSFRINERSAIQQGFFICQGDLGSSFEENLASVLESHCRCCVRKFIIRGDLDLQCRILHRLHKMNMSRATLFPGLEGFAKSIASRLWMAEVR
jgi:FRG domain